MDDTDTTNIDFNNPPIITLGDDLQGILGIDSTDSSIFTDILLHQKADDELDREIQRLLRSPKARDTLDITEFIVSDEIVNTPNEHSANTDSTSPSKSSNLATEYESLARSILVPSPEPVVDETKKYACSWCPRRFPDQRYLNRHLSKHTDRFTCPHCGRSFARKESKIKHIPRCKVVHPDCRKRKKAVLEKVAYSCATCFQQFTRKENYDQHMLKHKGLRILCNVCQKSCCSWKSFLMHKKLHECTRTVYFCAHCAATFMFKSNLQRHLRLAQKTKNTVVCSECNLTVKNEEILNKHKSQPIKKCIICAQRFCLEKHLRKHRKALHPEMWFKCKLCQQGTIFTARSEHNLRDHVRKTHDLSLKFMECYEEGMAGFSMFNQTTTTTTPFATPSMNTMNTMNTTPAFGVTPTQQNLSFGTVSTPAFESAPASSTSAFGMAKPQFGSPSTPLFGGQSTTTTPAGSIFGSSVQSPSFGQPQSTTSTQAAPIFGGAAVQSPSFATTQPKPAFGGLISGGTPPTTLTFGAPATTSQPGLTFGSAPATSQPGLSFGSTPATSQPAGLTFGSAPATSQPGLSFGSTPAASQPGLSFGSAPATSQPSLFGSAAATAPTGLTFGSTAATPQTGLSFGSAPATSQPGLSFSAAPATSQPGLSFSAAPATSQPGLSFSAAPATSQPGLSFNAAPATSQPGLSFSAAPATSQPGLSFSAVPATSQTGLTFGATPTTSQPSLSFGPVSTAPQTGVTAPQTGITFGTPANTAANPQTGLTFGGTATSTVAASIAPTSLPSGIQIAPAQTAFGMPAATTTTQTGISFGVPSSTSAASLSLAPTLGVAATTAAPALTFGAAAAASTTSQPSLQFGTGSSLSTTATTSTPSLFGGLAGSSSMTPASTAPNLFGNLTPSTTTSAASTSGATFSWQKPSDSSATAPPGTTSIGLGGIDHSAVATTPSSANTITSVKEQPLPNEIQQTVLAFKEHVKTQKNLSSEVARSSAEQLTKLTQQITAINNLILNLGSVLSQQKFTAEKIKLETIKSLNDYELVQKVKDSPVTSEERLLSIRKYFTEKISSFEQSTKALQEKIEYVYHHVSTLPQENSLSAEALKLIVKKLHDSFVVIGGRTYKLHNDMQLLKVQYMTLRNQYVKDNSSISFSLNRELELPMETRAKPSDLMSLEGPNPFSRSGYGSFNSLLLTSQNRNFAASTSNPSVGGLLNTSKPFGFSDVSGVSTLFDQSTSPGLSSGQQFNLQKPPLGNKRGKR